MYRGSPLNANFCFMRNRVIRGFMLSKDWFSTKICENGNFKVHFYSIIRVKTKETWIQFTREFLLYLNDLIKIPKRIEKSLNYKKLYIFFPWYFLKTQSCPKLQSLELLFSTPYFDFPYQFFWKSMLNREIRLI